MTDGRGNAYPRPRSGDGGAGNDFVLVLTFVRIIVSMLLNRVPHLLSPIAIEGKHFREGSEFRVSCGTGPLRADKNEMGYPAEVVRTRRDSSLRSE